MDILRAIENKQETVNNISEIFEELAVMYGDSVYKFCRSLTYSKEDADDLFQETFLKIFEQPHKIRDFENPQNFIFSTALYIWKSWKRKYARRNRLAPVEYLEENAKENIESGINIEDNFIIQEEIRATRELVDALPDKFKIPVIMYYKMEMSIPDITAALKLPGGTIKSRLFKARKIIEKGLGAMNYEK